MTFDISIMWCTGQVCVQHQVSLILELAVATEASEGQSVVPPEAAGV